MHCAGSPFLCPCSFDLQPISESRTYHFRAPNDAECRSWARALSAAVTVKANKRTQGWTSDRLSGVPGEGSKRSSVRATKANAAAPDGKAASGAQEATQAGDAAAAQPTSPPDLPPPRPSDFSEADVDLGYIPPPPVDDEKAAPADAAPVGGEHAPGGPPPIVGPPPPLPEDLLQKEREREAAEKAKEDELVREKVRALKAKMDAMNT